MQKKRSSLMTILLIVTLWASILVGATYAQFTDNVQVNGNIVTSGNLKAGLQWAEKFEGNNTEWKDAANQAIFNYPYWEPGFTDVKYIRIDNKGSLAFQYKLNVLPPKEVLAGPANLMNVIDVYYGEIGPDQVITRENYTTLTRLGTLNELVTGACSTPYGILLPEKTSANTELPTGANADTGSVTACIVLHMQESAGNEYQNLPVGEGFNLQLYATQYTYEKDSFDNSYDEEADSAFPVLSTPTNVTVNVQPNAEGCVPNAIDFTSSTGVTATVPEGAKMADGATSLTLVVEHLSRSSANVNLSSEEELVSYNVKVVGLAEDNDVPVIINMGEVLPTGLNMGNYALYHVENGQTSTMNHVDTLAAHNDFTYDPATGEVSVAMATFSEVALVADTENKWEGNYDYKWYDTNATEMTIANADQLAGFGQIVGGMVEGIEKDSFAGKTVKLISDVNLGDKESENNPDLIFYPIGYYNSNKRYEKVSGVSVTSGVNSFEGTFDGNGHIISNFYQNTWEMFGDYNDGYTGTPNHYKDAMGLFGYVVNGTVKNLTVDNFSSDGEFTPTGVIAAYAVNSTFENIAITNCNPRVYNTGNGGIVGIGGDSSDTADKKLTFTNITIDNSNKISALWGSWDVACGGIMGMFRGNGLADFNNCHVAAQIDVYNDVCGNYQYYWYRYSGMMIGSIRKNTTENGYTVPDSTGIEFKACSATYGDWADYVYCEFVDNSQASYTEDYQFSRVEEDELKRNGDEIKCTHTHKDVEDKRAVLLPFNQLFTGDGWGVKAVSEFDGVTVYHKDDSGAVRNSVEKFYYTDVELKADKVYTVGELFEEIDGRLNVSSAGVVVSITDLDDSDGIVSAEYTVINPMGWEENTIQFTGTGEVKLIIQDYYFCTPTTVTVTIGEPEKVDKFKAYDNLVFEHTVEGGIIEKKLGDIFEAVEGMQIDSAKVTVEVNDKILCTYDLNEDNWTQSKLSFKGTGTVTITITDNNFCIPAETTVTITEPNPVDKFKLVFENTDKYLYRVGNANPVALGSLFRKIDESVEIGNVSVTVEALNGAGVSGTYATNASDWTKGTIQFGGTGVVKVTITDNNYCIPTELELEVVDAVNATSATSATSNNVVLLNDCGFSSLEVSGGYTLYGNGFTMTCGSDSAALDMGYAFVTLNDGTLDNVQIVCPNFDYAALYKSNLTSIGNRSEIDVSGKTRYYNAKSGVMAFGNSQILNSRVSGGRAAVNVSGGNLVIDNSRIELGAVASVLVGSANSLTLRDVTLVQKPTASNYDSSKTLMGFSVLYLCDSEGNAAPTTIEGSLVQQAWINESDQKYVPSAGEDIVTAVLKETDYLHDIDGNGTKESLNLGFAYMPEELTSSVTKPTNITDNRTDKATIPYEMKDVEVTLSIFSTTVYVYSYKNTNGTADSFKTESEYVSNKYSDIITVTYSDTAEGLTTGKSFDTDGWVYELNVDLDKLSGYALDFSKLSMSVNGVLVNDYKVNGNAKPTSPVAVTAGGTTYTLTATIDGKEYTAIYKVTGTETSKESPSLVASDYEAGLCVASSHGGTWHGAAPALEGIQIKYWSVAESQYKTIDLSDYTPTTPGKLNGTNTTWTYRPDNGDFTLTLTGGQVHSSNNVYAMPVVCDGKLYFVAASSKGLVNSGNSARTISVSYVFEDNNNGTPLTFSHTWSVAENKNEQYKYSDFCTGTLTKLASGSSSGGGTCLAAGTLITMADGSKRAVEDLRKGDVVMAFDHLTGEITTNKVIIVVQTGSDFYQNTFVFDDGSELVTINEHGIYDLNLNRYVNIDHLNANDYIGHDYVKIDPNGQISTKKLIEVDSEFIDGYKYDIVTEHTLNYVAEDTLSVTHVLVDIINTFEFSDDMCYDQEKMEADIQKHGLYTYDEWREYADISVFEEYNIPVMKVGVSKGMYTKEYILSLINTFVLDDSVQIID